MDDQGERLWEGVIWPGLCVLLGLFVSGVLFPFLPVISLPIGAAAGWWMYVSDEDRHRDHPPIAPPGTVRVRCPQCGSTAGSGVAGTEFQCACGRRLRVPR